MSQTTITVITLAIAVVVMSFAVVLLVSPRARAATQRQPRGFRRPSPGEVRIMPYFFLAIGAVLIAVSIARL